MLPIFVSCSMAVCILVQAYRCQLFGHPVYLEGSHSKVLNIWTRVHKNIRQVVSVSYVTDRVRFTKFIADFFFKLYFLTINTFYVFALLSLHNILRCHVEGINCVRFQALMAVNRQMPVFRDVRINAESSFEMPVPFYQITRCHVTECGNPQLINFLCIYRL
jgi:hypothetical protein